MAATKAKISQHSTNMKRSILLLYDEHSTVIFIVINLYAFVHLFQFLLLAIKLLVVGNFNIAMNCTVPNCCKLICPVFKEFVSSLYIHHSIIVDYLPSLENVDF